MFNWLFPSFENDSASVNLHQYTWEDVRSLAARFRQRYGLDGNDQEYDIHDFLHEVGGFPPEPNDGGIVYFQDGFEGNRRSFSDWDYYNDLYDRGAELRRQTAF